MALRVLLVCLSTISSARGSPPPVRLFRLEAADAGTADGPSPLELTSTGALYKRPSLKTDDAWSGPRMRSARIGPSPVRHFLLGDAAEPIFPLWFSANGQNGTAQVKNVYAQVSLAAAEGVRLFTVVLTMADYLTHGGNLSPGAVRMLRRVVELAPEGYVMLRLSFEGGASLGMEMNTVMSATNGSTMLCGCSWATKGGGPNGSDDCASPTAAWAKAAATQLKLLLRAADATIPGKVSGVQFIGLSTGEWELPHDDFVSLLRAFLSDLVIRFSNETLRIFYRLQVQVWQKHPSAAGSKTDVLYL